MELLQQPQELLKRQKQQESQEESTGTTIMAVSYNGGVIVGADSRTSSGSYIASRVTDKLDFVHDRIFCLRSGSAADTQTLARYVRYGINMHSVELNKLPHVKTVARLFQNYMYQYKDALSASIIVAGWDPYDGPQVYAVPPGGAVFKQKYALGGSGSGYIQSYVDDNFRENMSLQEAKNLVLKAVSHAASRDGSSGGCCRMVNITKDSVEREFFDYNNLPVKA